MTGPLQKVFHAARFAGLSALVLACGGGSPPAASPAAASSVEGASAPSAEAAATAPAVPKARADASLLPRQLIFGNPDRTGPRISHDGKRIGWIAPKDGVLNVYVAPVDDLSKAKAVTDSKVRPIPFFLWAYDNQHVL